MSAQLLDFPRPLPSIVRCAIAAPRREYSFAEVVRMLGMGALEQRTQVKQLRRLAVQGNLPLPKNPRFRAGILQSGEMRIGQRSVWCALEFDAWAAGQGNPPPAAAAAAVPPLPRSLRATLRHRAAVLGGR